jgi:hypothetical protein
MKHHLDYHINSPLDSSSGPHKPRNYKKLTLERATEKNIAWMTIITIIIMAAIISIYLIKYQ